MIEAVTQVAGWVGRHPHWSGGAIALVAFSESLAFVGLAVPGAVMMFAAGALVAAGVVGFWPVFLWAVAGAVAGDWLSFALGRRYGGLVRGLRVSRRHPELLARAEAFFHRHGAKSVVLGRFVGPVRPLLPVVAGMLGMAPAWFLFSNVLSALIWAPAYLLPGMAFGASITLAAAVATRLALLAALFVISAWAVAAAMWRLSRFAGRRAEGWALSVSRWAGGRRRAAWLLGDLVDPGRPPGRALALWVVLLVGGLWLFLGVLEDVVTVDPLVRADQALYHLLQGLRGPPGDRLMVTLSAFGDLVVVAAVSVFVSLWLLRKRAWHDLGYWLAATGFGALAVAALKALLQVPRPVSLYTGVDAYSFPSGHATMAMVVYGFAAVLSAGELPPRWRALPPVVASLLVSGIAVSRLYLGAH